MSLFDGWRQIVWLFMLFWSQNSSLRKGRNINYKRKINKHHFFARLQLLRPALEQPRCLFHKYYFFTLPSHILEFIRGKRQNRSENQQKFVFGKKAINCFKCNVQSYLLHKVCYLDWSTKCANYSFCACIVIQKQLLKDRYAVFVFFTRHVPFLGFDQIFHAKIII